MGSFIHFLTNDIVRTVLLIIGIAGVVIEIATVGSFGAFGTIGIIAFVLYFMGSIWAGSLGIGCSYTIDWRYCVVAFGSIRLSLDSALLASLVSLLVLASLVVASP